MRRREQQPRFRPSVMNLDTLLTPYHLRNLNETYRQRTKRHRAYDRTDRIKTYAVYTHVEPDYGSNRITQKNEQRTLRDKINEQIRTLRVCRTRKMRRETLFKMGGIGGGIKTKAKRIFTEDSRIKCK